MIKREELSNPNSCMSRAEEDEMVFVLLSRDSVAPFAIREWVKERIRLGKNDEGDTQVTEALECALKMETQYNMDDLSLEMSIHAGLAKALTEQLNANP